MSESVHMPGADWPEFRPGWVWLCGAGPGDPGLVTLHGLNALRQADVVVHDALVNPDILTWADGAEIVYAGKRGGKPSPSQRDISLKLIELARQGRRILRLKGGDPFVFGRGGEEALTLIGAGIPVRVIPGISAGIGGLASAGIPVTHRDINQSVTFVTGHDQTGQTPGALDWGAIARASETVVIYMGMKHAATIANALMAGGRAADEPVAVVCDATLPAERVLETTLGCLAADLDTGDWAPPAILCVGRAVLLRHTLDWAAVARGDAPLARNPLGGPAPTSA